MIDPQEQYIQQKVQAYLQRCISNHGQYTHFSKARCSSMHRGEIYERVRAMLRLMGIPYEEPPGWQTSYKIKVLRREDLPAR